MGLSESNIFFGDNLSLPSVYPHSVVSHAISLPKAIRGSVVPKTTEVDVDCVTRLHAFTGTREGKAAIGLP